MAAGQRAVFSLCVLALGSIATECPTQSVGFKSKGNVEEADRTKFSLINEAKVPIVAKWIDPSGKSVGSSAHKLRVGAQTVINTFVGHSFRITAAVEGEPLLLEHTVTAKDDTVRVQLCDGVEPIDENAPLVSPRAEEFAKLTHDQDAPCLPEGKSGEWSCIRYISKEDYAKRPTDGSVYGFANQKEAGHRKVGEMIDTGYIRQIPQIPRISQSRGYLKMTWSDNMKKILRDWYNKHKKGGENDAVQIHPPIPGGYTNSRDVALTKIDLDDFRPVQRAVANEMQEILEWWTGRELTHTSTFGVRIYHRGSMLIDHVDRADTHLASAVIQIAQDVDEDGGWPLEVLDAEGNCGEVYLQPEELVLYEGARFRHGRPMRFNGTSFANIFSHFAPLDWHGPNKSPRYDGLLDSKGFLQTHELGAAGGAGKQEL